MLEYYSTQPTYDSFMLSLLDTEWLVFGLQACEEASVALQEYPGIATYSAYEVLIGYEGNSGTGIADKVGKWSAHHWNQTDGLTNQRTPVTNLIHSFT